MRQLIQASWDAGGFKPEELLRGRAVHQAVGPFAPVLYAEDTEADGFFMQRAFVAAAIPNPLTIVSAFKDRWF